MRWILIFLVRGYQGILSPLLPSSCRFFPNCSAYAIEALERYGSVKGTVLTIYRVSRCQPFCTGGYDPVP